MTRTDLRVALRSLLQRPLLTAVALLTLALGIGANAAIFSLADAVTFRPLQVRAPGSLVALYATRREGPVMGFSFPDYLDLRGAIPGLEAMAGYHEEPLVVARGNGDPQPAWGHLVTESYFPLLGLEPAAGRLFGGDEAGRDGHGGTAVAVLSHDFFQRRFGGDRSLIGSTIRVSGHPFTVVGVAPAGFGGTRSLTFQPDLWVPIAQHLTLFPDWPQMLERREWGSLYLLARLAPGARLDAVNAAASAAGARLAAAHPDTTSREDVVVFSNRTSINPYLGSPGKLRATALVMLLGVALVLLVACANVANLLLVGGTSRRRELAVRASLGAGRWRLARQLLLESSLLSLAGGAAGLAIGGVATRLLAALIPPTTHQLAFDLRLDLRVALFALLLAAVSTLLFGLLPARRAASTDPAAELRGGPSAGGRGGRPLVHALVAAQVAFSLVVLTAGSLFLRSLWAAQRIDLGFRADGALVFGLDATLHRNPADAPDRLQRRVADAVRALPGVSAVAWTDDLPLNGNSNDIPMAPTGQGRSAAAQVTTYTQNVGESFFDVMGIPFRAGRTFAAADRDSTVERVVVSEAFARRLFPRREAVGERFEIGGPQPLPLEVVGVVRDTKVNWLGEAPPPFVYFDSRRSGNGTAHPLFVVRHAGDSGALLAAIRGEVRRIDAQLPITNVSSLREHLAPALALPRDGAYLATSFALLALLLASSGIFGVIAHGVAQRARELAIRLAVGARPRALLGTVLGATLRLLAVGVAGGLLGGALVGGLLRGLLYGISPRDPLAFAAAAATVLAVGLAATLPPALRVLAVDPARVLRSDT
jgi:predicted permease